MHIVDLSINFEKLTSNIFKLFIAFNVKNSYKVCKLTG